MMRLPISSLSLNHTFIQANDSHFICYSVINMVQNNEKCRLIGTRGSNTIRIGLKDFDNTIVEIYMYIHDKYGF